MLKKLKSQPGIESQTAMQCIIVEIQTKGSGFAVSDREREREAGLELLWDFLTLDSYIEETRDKRRMDSFGDFTL